MNELATIKNYQLATLTGDLADMVAEEMDGLGTIPFDRVKVPSGGQTAFEVPGETEDDTQVVKAIRGVILYHHPVNAYWANPFGGAGDSAPDCSAIDGHQGVTADGEVRSCDTCRYNQFGTGAGGRGKACKNSHRVYILPEGSPIPMILNLPPTSLKTLRNYIGKSLLVKGLKSYEVITEISLKKIPANGTVPAYSQAVFTLKGKVPEDGAAAVAGMREMVKGIANNVGVTEDTAVTGGEFQSVDEALPFDM